MWSLCEVIWATKTFPYTSWWKWEHRVTASSMSSTPTMMDWTASIFWDTKGITNVWRRCYASSEWTSRRSCMTSLQRKKPVSEWRLWTSSRDLWSRQFNTQPIQSRDTKSSTWDWWACLSSTQLISCHDTAKSWPNKTWLWSVTQCTLPLWTNLLRVIGRWKPCLTSISTEFQAGTISSSWTHRWWDLNKAMRVSTQGRASKFWRSLGTWSVQLTIIRLWETSRVKWGYC